MKIKTPIFLFVFAGTALLLFIVAIVPKWRDSFQNSVLQNFAKPPQRHILAKLKHHHLLYLKLKFADQMYLEVYSVDPQRGQTQFLANQPLMGSEDAHIKLQDKISNLALVDINKDGVLDLIAPTYDQQQNTFLNALSFNEGLKIFTPLSPPQTEELDEIIPQQ